MTRCAPTLRLVGVAMRSDDEAVQDSYCDLAQLDDVVAALPPAVLKRSWGRRGTLRLWRPAPATWPCAGARCPAHLPRLGRGDLESGCGDRAACHCDTGQPLHGGPTTIIVTHRVATVRDCDYIVYLEAGLVRAIRAHLTNSRRLSPNSVSRTMTPMTRPLVCETAAEILHMVPLRSESALAQGR